MVAHQYILLDTQYMGYNYYRITPKFYTDGLRLQRTLDLYGPEFKVIGPYEPSRVEGRTAELLTMHEREEERTIEEWCKITGFQIIDPDGFDRSDPLLMERLFTHDEFIQGAFASTCIYTSEGSEYAVNQMSRFPLKRLPEIPYDDYPYP